MKWIPAAALVLLLAASTCPAQESWTTDGLRTSGSGSGGIDFRGAQKAFRGLLDPKRFNMSHTVGMSFGSGAWGGSNQYYLNTMTYEFSPKLTAVAQVGVQHTLGGTPAFGSASSRTQVIVPNVGLFYTPRPNIRIELQMSQMPNSVYYRPYGLYSDPFAGR